MLDSLSHLLAVVAIKVVFYPPPVIRLGVSDASPQVSSGSFVKKTICEHLKVWMFTDVPVTPVETVL